MKFRMKPVVIDAIQWFKNGDHPEDGDQETEGDVVRYYRTPAGDGQSVCEQCGHIMHNHGWIDNLEVGHDVCVGDWIITGTQQERYPCKPGIFNEIYEKI